MNSTAIDDDYWVRSKIATAKHFGHSSYYIACLLASQKSAITLRQKYFLNEADYSAFPLIIKGTGVVGTITVSGCHYSKDDHYLVYENIRSYLEELEQAAYSQAEH